MKMMSFHEILEGKHRFLQEDLMKMCDQMQILSDSMSSTIDQLYTEKKKHKLTQQQQQHYEDMLSNLNNTYTANSILMKNTHQQLRLNAKNIDLDLHKDFQKISMEEYQPLSSLSLSSLIPILFNLDKIRYNSKDIVDIFEKVTNRFQEKLSELDVDNIFLEIITLCIKRCPKLSSVKKIHFRQFKSDYSKKLAHIIAHQFTGLLHTNQFRHFLLQNNDLRSLLLDEEKTNDILKTKTTLQMAKNLYDLVGLDIEVSKKTQSSITKKKYSKKFTKVYLQKEKEITDNELKFLMQQN